MRTGKCHVAFLLIYQPMSTGHDKNAWLIDALLLLFLHVIFWQEKNRQIRSIMNKLTPEKFDTLLGQIMALNICTEMQLTGLINIIFEKVRIALLLWVKWLHAFSPRALIISNGWIIISNDRYSVRCRLFSPKTLTRIEIFCCKNQDSGWRKTKSDLNSGGHCHPLIKFQIAADWILSLWGTFWQHPFTMKGWKVTSKFSKIENAFLLDSKGNAPWSCSTWKLTSFSATSCKFVFMRLIALTYGLCLHVAHNILHVISLQAYSDMVSYALT